MNLLLSRKKNKKAKNVNFSVSAMSPKITLHQINASQIRVRVPVYRLNRIREPRPCPTKKKKKKERKKKSSKKSNIQPINQQL